MSTLGAIEDAGLKDDLEVLFAEFFKKDDAKAKSELMKIIDKHGLQCPEVIKQVGALQRAEVLEPGIYKKFKDLNAQLAGGGKSGGNGASEAAKPAPKKEEPKQAKSEPKQTEMEVTEEKDVTIVEESFVDDDEGGDGVLTKGDEDDIREALRKEEEKWRKKIADKERRLREQKMKKNKKKANRLGLKAEEAAKIAELKATIAGLQEANKKLKAEVKANNDAIKKMRTEIAEIRPKKQPKPKTDSSGKKTSSAAKVDAEELKAAVTVITDFLKDNPGSKSADIKNETGVDGALYNAAISSMKEAGKVEQAGRGPFTNYTLC